MSSLMIGSSAARFHIPAWRNPKDADYWANGTFADTFESLKGFDIFWHPLLQDLLTPGVDRVATLDELYTIKRSHAYWELRNGSWTKHMADMLALEDAGAKFIPEWHDHLYKVWEDVHGKKVIDLTQEAEDFFTDAVTRLYVHDSIHESVAYHDRPIYEECLKDGKSVQMDMDKVWAMPFERQVQMFREEIYVTALERLVIPHDYMYSAGRAYQWALRRTITGLTKGASARFLVENYRLFSKPDCDYVARHRENSDRLVRL